MPLREEQPEVLPLQSNCVCGSGEMDAKAEQEKHWTWAPQAWNSEYPGEGAGEKVLEQPGGKMEARDRMLVRPKRDKVELESFGQHM